MLNRAAPAPSNLSSTLAVLPRFTPVVVRWMRSSAQRARRGKTDRDWAALLLQGWLIPDITCMRCMTKVVTVMVRIVMISTQ